MPNYNFEFETIADGDGNIIVEEEFDIPLSVKISNLSVETTSHCNNRSHNVIITIDNNNIIEKLVDDCSVVNEELNITVSSGLKKIKLLCDRFEQNEVVKGNGKVNYSISFFPFGLVAPNAEQVDDLENPLVHSTKNAISDKIKSLTNFIITESQ